MIVISSFSGGKDSHAATIWATKNFKNVVPAFCDVKWEYEFTYDHLKYVCEFLKIDLKILTSNKFDGFLDLAKKKGRFPSTKARFCTEELKSKPMIDFVLSQNDNILMIQGIRKDESLSRSKMQESCRYFKYYFEPYTSNKIIIDNFNEIKKPSFSQKTKYNKALQRLKEGKNDEKYHTYRKEEVFEWCKKYDDSILRPVFEWTAQQTIDYIIENGQKPNPLYFLGAGRVGCFPCIMVTHSELKALMQMLPEIVQMIIDAEEFVGSGFFPPNYIPKRFQTGVSKNGKKYPKAIDVFNYLTEFSGDLFEEENQNRSCMSHYGICE